MWQNNLHVRVTYKGVERGTFGTERRIHHNFDVSRAGWYGDYPDPTTWLDLARSDNVATTMANTTTPPTTPSWQSPTRNPTPPNASRCSRRPRKILMEQDLPFIPLYQYTDGDLYDKTKITGR